MPIKVSCEGCGAEFSLKDQYAGRQLRCPKCDHVLHVPSLEEELEPAAWENVNPAFHRDKFLMRQKVMTINQTYVVSDERNAPILWVKRPARLARTFAGLFAGVFTGVAGMGLVVAVMVAAENLGLPEGARAAVGIVSILLALVLAIAVAIWISPKRHVGFYTDQQFSRCVLEALQDRKMYILRTTYTVRDPNEGVLGQFVKNNLSNIIRRCWRGYDSNGNLFVICREDSMILSLLRRFLGPLFGVLRTNFIIQLPKGQPGHEPVIGEFNRKLTLFDRYVLDMSKDRERILDRRMAVALAILLDTGERR